MQNEVLIALLSKLVEEKLSELPIPSASGSRGFRGPPGLDGKDGKSFVFDEYKDQIRSWVKEFSLKFSDLTDEEIKMLKGPRGEKGSAGKDGKSISFEDHEKKIKEWVKSFSLKFSDLTDEEILQLKGPRGEAGAVGRDGKDFVFEEHEGKIKEWINDSSLKFSDLTDEEILQLKGPRGEKGSTGRDGKSFIFDEHSEWIWNTIREHVSNMSEALKLRFSDLTEEDIGKIRGPRGRDGRDGKDFIFDEHIEFFKSLKIRFSDLTDDEISRLTLKFSDLTDRDKELLKLKFEDLTLEDKLAIRGSRGQRGRTGDPGKNGDKGETGLPGVRGIRGLPGPTGIPGIHGRNGQDGRDGIDAPIITSVDIEQDKDSFNLVFRFSDGSKVISEDIDLPSRIKEMWIIGGGTSSSSNPSNVQQVPKLIQEFDTDVDTVPGDFVVVNGPGSVTRITDNLSATMPNGIFGVAYSKTTPLKVDVLFAGIKPGYAGLTAGLPVFISPTGVPTHTPPALEMVQQIGFATSATEIFLHLMIAMRRS